MDNLQTAKFEVRTSSLTNEMADIDHREEVTAIISELLKYSKMKFTVETYELYDTIVTTIEVDNT